MTELYRHKFFSAIFPLSSGVMVSTPVKGARGPGFKSRPRLHLTKVNFETLFLKFHFSDFFINEISTKKISTFVKHQ